MEYTVLHDTADKLRFLVPYQMDEDEYDLLSSQCLIQAGQITPWEIEPDDIEPTSKTLQLFEGYLAGWLAVHFFGHETIDWCDEQNIAVHMDTFTWIWDHQYVGLQFQNANDAMRFKLRWVGA